MVLYKLVLYMSHILYIVLYMFYKKKANARKLLNRQRVEKSFFNNCMSCLVFSWGESGRGFLSGPERLGI